MDGGKKTLSFIQDHIHLHRRAVRKRYLLPIVFLLALPCRAEFGDASFPEDTFSGGPRSYHDVWCRKLKNECRVIFSGPTMAVEGEGGVLSSQLMNIKVDTDGEEYYTYLTYRGSNGNPRVALFLFVHNSAYMEFLRALTIWRRQAIDARPNYRYPGSQGPQETQGRDKGQNPYSSQN